MTAAGTRFPNVDTVSVGDVVDYQRKVDGGKEIVQVRITRAETHPRNGGVVIEFEPV